jgi:hypothetical protein
VRLKSYYLSDSDLKKLARRAESLRRLTAEDCSPQDAPQEADRA